MGCFSRKTRQRLFLGALISTICYGVSACQPETGKTSNLRDLGINQRVWVDQNTQISWTYSGIKPFTEAAGSCSLYGGVVPGFQDVLTALRDGIASKSNATWLDGEVNVLEFGSSSIWVNNPASDPRQAYVIRISGQDALDSAGAQNHVICMTQGSSRPLPPPPPSVSYGFRCHGARADVLVDGLWYQSAFVCERSFARNPSFPTAQEKAANCRAGLDFCRKTFAGEADRRCVPVACGSCMTESTTMDANAVGDYCSFNANNTRPAPL